MDLEFLGTTPAGAIEATDATGATGESFDVYSTQSPIFSYIHATAIYGKEGDTDNKPLGIYALQYYDLNFEKPAKDVNQEASSAQAAATNAVTQLNAPLTVIGDINVTHPQDSRGAGSQIRYCHARMSRDCDYHNQGNIITFPLQGEVVITNPIDGNKALSFPDNWDDLETKNGWEHVTAFASISHKNRDGGGCELFGDPEKPELGMEWLKTKATTSPTKITWDDQSRTFTSGEFRSCLPRNTSFAFVQAFNLPIVQALKLPNVPVEQKSYRTANATIISGVNPEKYFEGFTYTFNINTLPNMTSFWSCIVGESIIQYENGETGQIKDVVEGARIVIDEKGSIGAVQAIYRGEPDGEEVHKIVTSSGRDLSLTPTHPLTRKTALTAEEEIVHPTQLNVGDLVLTVDGYEEVASLSSYMYEDRVFNLRILPDSEVDGSGSQYDNTFVANGMVIGDSEMQWAHDDGKGAGAVAYDPTPSRVEVVGGKTWRVKGDTRTEIKNATTIQ